MPAQVGISCAQTCSCSAQMLYARIIPPYSGHNEGRECLDHLCAEGYSDPGKDFHTDGQTFCISMQIRLSLA